MVVEPGQAVTATSLNAFTSVSNGDDFALMCIFACDFFLLWHFFRSKLRMCEMRASARTHAVRPMETWSPLTLRTPVSGTMLIVRDGGTRRAAPRHATQCHALFQRVLSISVTGFSWLKTQYSVGSYFSMSPRLIVEQSCGDWPMQMCVNCAKKFNKEEAPRTHGKGNKRERMDKTVDFERKEH